MKFRSRVQNNKVLYSKSKSCHFIQIRHLQVCPNEWMLLITVQLSNTDMGCSKTGYYNPWKNPNSSTLLLLLWEYQISVWIQIYLVLNKPLRIKPYFPPGKGLSYKIWLIDGLILDARIRLPPSSPSSASSTSSLLILSPSWPSSASSSFRVYQRLLSGWKTINSSIRVY